MNRILTTLIMATFSVCSYGQAEFKTYDNGLIYSKATMSHLERIVDSLNLKYKYCDLNKVYYSKMQATGHIVRLDTLDVMQAKKDIESNISFEAFVLKYPYARIQKNVLVVKNQYENYESKKKVEYNEVDLNDDYGLRIIEDNNNGQYQKALASGWIYDYNEKTQYSDESIKAIFFPEGFKSVPLNKKYSRQIGYSDCLIDTNTTKFKKNAKEGWIALPDDWEKLSLKKQKTLLDKMRSTAVIGGCSMDSRPRVHAVNIALLAAATTNWEVFLKSHLDIMNDRFDRASDGSYAWAKRKTYIKELEELDINVLDLLLGISFRMENPAVYHYYGSIGRLGRAISESKNRSEFENEMLSIIEDKELDDYNRVIGYFLFISYNSYLENKEEQKVNIERVKKSINTLPDNLKEQIKI